MISLSPRVKVPSRLAMSGSLTGISRDTRVLGSRMGLSAHIEPSKPTGTPFFISIPANALEVSASFLAD